MRFTLIGLLLAFFFLRKGDTQGCRDRTVRCQDYVRYCNVIQHQATMKRSCQLTCGYCSCYDQDYCGSFKSLGCVGGFYSFALRRDCPVMCNSCSSRTNMIASVDATPERSCLVHNGGCYSGCIETKRRVQCYCQPGFDLNDDGVSCRDINECSSENNHCAMQLEPKVCINTRGSFMCQPNSCSDYPGHFNKYNSNECCYKEPSQTCGIDTVTVRNDIPRIVGGKAAHFTAWPWMVQIWIEEDKLCGGTLISDSWVLSAAHCFDNITASTKVSLVFGRLKANSTPTEESHVQWRKSIEITFHPEYNAEYFALRDIVLIRLDRAVKLTKFVNPICLPNGEKPPPGTTCWASGFGTTGFGGQLAKHLQEVDLKIVSKPDCNQAYPHVQSLIDSSSLFCAGNKFGKKDTCQGDSGGPLMCQRCASCSWYLTGITSSGRSCSRTYGLYTDVLKHEDWISRVTGIPVNKERTCRKQHETQWTGWTEWGECSKTCGGGEKMRYRSCWAGEIGSPKCSGAHFQSHPCQVLPCVDHNKKLSNGGYEVVFKTMNNADMKTLIDSDAESGSLPEEIVKYIESMGLSPDSVTNTDSD